LKTAGKSKKQPIESMRKYENPSKQKFKKSACLDLGNGSSIHLSYGSSPCTCKITVCKCRYKFNGEADYQLPNRELDCPWDFLKVDLR
jgi:hypothetical protein